MMSEQQFALDKLYYSIMTPIEKISVGRCYMTYREVVDTLNEQQSIITKLKELNDDKGKRIISLIRINKTLKEENEQLRGINKETRKLVMTCTIAD